MKDKISNKQMLFMNKWFFSTEALNINEFLYNVTAHSPPSFDQA